jgi:hypothetical protein
MSDTVKEQKAITATDNYQFVRQLDSEFERGWRIVPGTVVATMVPESEHNNRQERYIAVVEK